MSAILIEVSELSRASPDYLVHHGIAKQQWGVRRGPPYPLKNGINTRVKKVTKAAKDRIERNRRTKTERRKATAEAKAKKKETLQDKINRMSDDELRARTARLRLENDFKAQLPKEQQGRTFLEKSSKLLKDLSATGDALSSFITTSKKLAKAFGLETTSEEEKYLKEFRKYHGKNSYADGESAADWSPVRKPGESMSDYAYRVGKLSGIVNNVNNVTGKGKGKGGGQNDNKDKNKNKNS